MSQDDANKDSFTQESFKQVCDTARHYGNLRFGFFTVSNLIIGFLVSVDFGAFGPLSDVRKLTTLRIFGTLIAVLFLLGHWRISKLINFYQEKANEFGVNGLKLPLPPKQGIWRFLVLVIIMSPLILTVVFWIVCVIFWRDQIFIK